MPIITLQVLGSLALAVTRISSGSTAITIATGDANCSLHLVSTFTGYIALPTAADNTGRVIFISNHTGATRNISIYRTGSATTATTITNNTELGLQSDGTEWFVISN